MIKEHFPPYRSLPLEQRPPRFTRPMPRFPRLTFTGGSSFRSIFTTQSSSFPSPPCHRSTLCEPLPAPEFLASLRSWVVQSILSCTHISRVFGFVFNYCSFDSRVSSSPSFIDTGRIFTVQVVSALFGFSPNFVLPFAFFWPLGISSVKSRVISSYIVLKQVLIVPTPLSFVHNS